MDANEKKLLEEKFTIDTFALREILPAPKDQKFKPIFESFCKSLIEESYKLNRLIGVDKEVLLESAKIKDKTAKQKAKEKIAKTKEKVMKKAAKNKNLAESLIKPKYNTKIMLENYFIESDSMGDDSIGIRLQKMMVETLIDNIVSI